MSINLTGYRIVEPIHQSVETTIYRAVREDDQEKVEDKVVIKTLNEYPLPKKSTV